MQISPLAERDGLSGQALYRHLEPTAHIRDILISRPFLADGGARTTDHNLVWKLSHEALICAPDGIRPCSVSARKFGDPSLGALHLSVTFGVLVGNPPRCGERASATVPPCSARWLALVRGPSAVAFQL
jgi:hypothetical protein